MISKSAPTHLHANFQGNLDWEEKVHTTTTISKYTADTPGMTVPLRETQVLLQAGQAFRHAKFDA